MRVFTLQYNPHYSTQLHWLINVCAIISVIVATLELSLSVAIEALAKCEQQHVLSVNWNVHIWHVYVIFFGCIVNDLELQNIWRVLLMMIGRLWAGRGLQQRGPSIIILIILWWVWVWRWRQPLLLLSAAHQHLATEAWHRLYARTTSCLHWHAARLYRFTRHCILLWFISSNKLSPAMLIIFQWYSSGI